jgi:hypothetical protein
MSDYVAALATVIAVFVMLRTERKDMAKASDLSRIEARIEALDTKLSARLDTVVLELGKAFGRPAG